MLDKTELPSSIFLISVEIDFGFWINKLNLLTNSGLIGFSIGIINGFLNITHSSWRPPESEIN
jgi:hypothetical protein